MSSFRGSASAALLSLLVWLSPAVCGQSPEATRAPGQDPIPQTRQPVVSWPRSSNRWALVIGIDQYRDGQISDLRGATNDAVRLSDALVRHAGFPADQVILLAGNQPEERQPTRINILRRLSNLASVIPKDGLLLISFAGHGIERRGQAYLLPNDAQLSDDITFLEDTAISVTRMRERIRTMGLKQVVILLDACRNDPGGRAAAPNRLTQAYVRGFNFDVRNGEVSAFATLFATGVGERAYEYAEKRQGYFTWAVIEGLKGAAADARGEVTLHSLVRYVQEAVKERIAVDLGANNSQRPFAVIEGYRANELVIAVSEARAAGGDSPSPSPDPAVAELEYWEGVKRSGRVEDYKAYLSRYPDGLFADIAKRRVSPPAHSHYPVGQGYSSEQLSVEVPGHSKGTDTGLVLRVGEFVTITATGSVVVGKKDGTVSPNGGKANFMSDRPVAGIGIGGLIGYIETPNGKKTGGFPVGSIYKFTVEAPGRLFLAINDRNLKDNGGSFSVRITRELR